MNVITDHHPDDPPSSLDRTKNCAASRTLCKKVPPESSPDAEEGSLLHTKLPPDVPLDGLDDEQREAVLWVREYIGARIEGAIKAEYEKSLVLWLGDTAVTWGTEDVVAFFPERVVIVDPKFGRIPITRDGCELTMRCYAAMAMQAYKVNRCEAWVCQPREKAELRGVYSEPVKIAAEIAGIIQYAKDHPEEYRPSPDACRYCRGKILCPAFREEVLALATQKRSTPMRVDEIGRALEYCSVLERWIRFVHATAHQAMDLGLKVPGWTRRSYNLREIEDIDQAFGRLAGVLKQEEFLSCCDVGLTRLREKYKEKAVAIGAAKTKAAADRALFAALGDLVKVRQSIRLSRASKEHSDDQGDPPGPSTADRSNLLDPANASDP